MNGGGVDASGNNSSKFGRVVNATTDIDIDSFRHVSPGPYGRHTCTNSRHSENVRMCVAHLEVTFKQR